MITCYSPECPLETAHDKCWTVWNSRRSAKRYKKEGLGLPDTASEVRSLFQRWFSGHQNMETRNLVDQLWNTLTLWRKTQNGTLTASKQQCRTMECGRPLWIGTRPTLGKKKNDYIHLTKYSRKLKFWRYILVQVKPFVGHYQNMRSFDFAYLCPYFGIILRIRILRMTNSVRIHMLIWTKFIHTVVEKMTETFESLIEASNHNIDNSFDFYRNQLWWAASILCQISRCTRSYWWISKWKPVPLW